MGSPKPYARGHWTWAAMRKFAQDIKLTSQLSDARLYRLFCACVQHRIQLLEGKEGKLCYVNWYLALVLIALHFHGKPGRTPVQCLSHLFVNIEMLSGDRSLRNALRDQDFGT